MSSPGKLDVKQDLGEHVTGLLAAFQEASLHFDAYRLPELSCGFPRRRAGGPPQYPVA